MRVCSASSQQRMVDASERAAAHEHDRQGQSLDQIPHILTVGERHTQAARPLDQHGTIASRQPSIGFHDAVQTDDRSGLSGGGQRRKGGGELIEAQESAGIVAGQAGTKPFRVGWPCRACTATGLNRLHDADGHSSSPQTDGQRCRDHRLADARIRPGHEATAGR